MFSKVLNTLLATLGASALVDHADKGGSVPDLVTQLFALLVCAIVQHAANKGWINYQIGVAIKASAQRAKDKYLEKTALARSESSPGGAIVTPEERSQARQEAMLACLASLTPEEKAVVDDRGEDWLKGRIGAELDGIVENIPRFAPAKAFGAALLCLLPLGGCMSSEDHDLALSAAEMSSELGDATGEDFRAYVRAADKRQRKSMNETFDALTIVNNLTIAAEFERQLAEATEAVPDSQPTAASRPMVSTTKVRALMVAQEKLRSESVEKLRLKREGIEKQLDEELDKWLNDPKERQRIKLSGALSIYVKQASAFQGFLDDVALKAKTLVNPAANGAIQ